MAAPDVFSSHARGLTAPATRFFAITPSDSTDLPAKPRAIWVGGAGNLAVSNDQGDSQVLQGIAAGTLLPISPDRVRATGTTATSLIGLY